MCLLIVDFYNLFTNYYIMSKIEITIKEITENYFLRDNNKLKILFSYNYFENFITRNWLQEIFSKKLYINWFDFEMVKIWKLDFNLDLESSDFISKLQTNMETYISEWLLYLWNDKTRKFGFFFFPDYLKNWEIKNDFLKIKDRENLDLSDYISDKWLFKRNWVVIALKI